MADTPLVAYLIVLDSCLDLIFFQELRSTFCNYLITYLCKDTEETGNNHEQTQQSAQAKMLYGAD